MKIIIDISHQNFLTIASEICLCIVHLILSPWPTSRHPLLKGLICTKTDFISGPFISEFRVDIDGCRTLAVQRFRERSYE